MNLRPIPIVLLVMVFALLVPVLGVTDVPGVTSTSQRVLPVERVTPVAGGSVCVTGADGENPTGDVLLLAAPVADEGDVDAVARALLLTRQTEGEERAFAPLPAGGFAHLPVELGAEGWSWVGWADHPTTAWQEWRTAGAPGRPSGRVTARCLSAEPPVQTLLGLRTDGGNEAVLRLANPFAADATFAVTFVTPSGVSEPIGLRNVSVRSGTRVSIRLNDHVPEEADVAAIVTVGAGRLAVQGLQRSVAELEGIEGLAAVLPIAAPATTWSFPWVATGPGVEGSLWVLNPEPRAVSVQLTVHTASGATVPDTDRVEVGPGALVRVDATTLAVDPSGVVGVTLRSETTGILAAAGAAYVDDDPARTGLVRSEGAPVPDGSWAIAGLAEQGRTSVVHVLNLGEAEVAPRVTLTTLMRAIRPTPEPAADAPADPDTAEASSPDTSPDDSPVGAEAVTEEILMRPIPPGGVGRLTLPLDGAWSFAAVIDGGPALVVARTTAGAERLEPVAALGVAAADLLGAGGAFEGLARTGWVAGLEGVAPAGDD